MTETGHGKEQVEYETDFEIMPVAANLIQGTTWQDHCVLNMMERRITGFRTGV